MNVTAFNRTASNNLLCLDVTVAEICGYENWSKAIVGISVVTILVNILHIFILSSIKKLRGTKYFWTLINIGSSDIFASLTFIVHMDCSLKNLILNQDEKLLNYLLVGLAIPYVMSTTLRLSVLALANYERYVAICTPFKYETNKIVQYLPAGYIIIWVVSFVTSVITKSINFGQFCVKDLGLTQSRQSFLVSAIQFPLFGILVVITVITLSKVGVELKRMSRRAIQPAEDEELKKAGKYVLLTSILFYLTFVPPIIAMGAKRLGKLPEEKTNLIDMSAFTIQVLYGSLNVILFIYLNPSYIQQLRKLLKCKLGHAVTPQVGHT